MSLLPNFVHSIRLPQPSVGWCDYRYAVLRGGTLALIRTNSNSATEAFKNRDWRNALLRLSCFSGETESGAIEVPATTRAPKIDRLPDGRWVVIGSRAGQSEANARIFSSDGLFLNGFEVGDGVGPIACSLDDRIWVGYFDEGIFCTSNQDGSWPPASSGLAAFDARGRCQWQFALEGYYISDCYALSASESTIWACTYQDFPIIRVDGSGVRSWKNGVNGAHAIAGQGDHVILAGGYNTDRNRVVLLHLDATEAVPVAEFRLPATLSDPLFTGGRDGILHVIAENQWLQIGIKDWLAAG